MDDGWSMHLAFWGSTCLRHCRTDSLSYGDSVGTESFEAMNIDPKVVWGYPLTVKRINPTNLTEVVPRSVCVKLVFSNRFCPAYQSEIIFMNFDHERVLPLADGAVAHRQFREIRVDLEPDLATIARTGIGFENASLHGFCD